MSPGHDRQTQPGMQRQQIKGVGQQQRIWICQLLHRKARRGQRDDSYGQSLCLWHAIRFDHRQRDTQHHRNAPRQVAPKPAEDRRGENRHRPADPYAGKQNRCLPALFQQAQQKDRAQNRPDQPACPFRARAPSKVSRMQGIKAQALNIPDKSPSNMGKHRILVNTTT